MTGGVQLRFSCEVTDDWGTLTEDLVLDHRPTLADLRGVAEAHARMMFETNDGLALISEILVSCEDCEGTARLGWASREAYGPAEDDLEVSA